MLLAIASVLVIAALAALILRPTLGIPLLFLVRPIVDATWAEPVFFDLNLLDVLGTLAPAIVICHAILGRGGSSFARIPVKGPWLALSAYTFVFSSIILFGDGWLTGLDVFFRQISGIVGFFMLQAWFRTEADLRRLFGTIALAGIFPMAIGLYEIATGVHWTEWQVEGLARNVGLYHDAFSVRFYMMQTLLSTLLYAALSPRLGVGRLAVAATYATGALVVVFKAYSKSAISTLLLWALAWTVLRRRWALLGAGAAVVAVVGTVFYSELTQPIAQLFNKELSAIAGQGALDVTFQGRWLSWREMIDDWRALSPWQQVFGSGMKSTGAHNDYLQLLFHGGVVGLSLYLTLLVAIGARVVRNARKRPSALNVAAVMALSMWIVDSIGLVPSAYPAYQWFVWGLIGVACRVDADGATEAREPRSKTSRIAFNYSPTRLGSRTVRDSR